MLPEGTGPFDLVFIDADKENIPTYFTWAVHLSQARHPDRRRQRGAEGALIDTDSTDVNIQGVRRFNELVSREPRVSATAVQTVGSKGYDGFAVLVVREA